jgi:hypothetical protein
MFIWLHSLSYESTPYVPPSERTATVTTTMAATTTTATTTTTTTTATTTATASVDAPWRYAVSPPAWAARDFDSRAALAEPVDDVDTEANGDGDGDNDARIDYSKFN